MDKEELPEEDFRKYYPYRLTVKLRGICAVTLLPLNEIEDELRDFWPWNRNRLGW